MAFARTIVEEDEVEQQIDAAVGQYARFEDLWEAWKWRLARDPSIDAVPVPGSNPQAYLAKSYDFGDEDFPASVTILFGFNEDEVRIQSVKFVEPPNAAAQEVA